MEDKCCGNCKHFKNEDIEGFSYCEIEHGFKCCDEVCVEHEAINNGWTEITSDNVDDVYKLDISRLVIAVVDSHGSPQYAKYDIMSTSINEMAKIGGCFYYVLPELRK
jgi:hypothetical protein